MFTPQQIEQITFRTETFGGYKKEDVDELLEQLLADYVTLYKENALLKSKMRVLVTKLEEYRQNEANMKDAIVNAQKTCDMMVKEAEAKCTQMLNEAGAAAAENSKNADALIAEENARVEEAKQAACAKIEEMEAQLNSCLQALNRIKEANRPAPEAVPVYDYENAAKQPEVDPTASVADEISSTLEALVGTTEDEQPKAEPNHPVSDTSTKFTNLRFGPNYDPTGR